MEFHHLFLQGREWNGLRQIHGEQLMPQSRAVRSTLPLWGGEDTLLTQSGYGGGRLMCLSRQLYLDPKGGGM